jgi:CRP/FNR family cyclic AMP-dependent transcriptional regulator
MKAAAQKSAYKLDEETRRIIAMTPDQENVAKGQVLFEEGDTGDQAYLIKEGEIEIVRQIGNTEHILARLGRGDIFGEMALIDNQPRMATARVAADAELAIITRENIEARLNRLAQSDMVVRRLIDVFVTRIRGEARLHE